MSKQCRCFVKRNRCSQAKNLLTLVNDLSISLSVGSRFVKKPKSGSRNKLLKLPRHEPTNYANKHVPAKESKRSQRKRRLLLVISFCSSDGIRKPKRVTR